MNVLDIAIAQSAGQQVENAVGYVLAAVSIAAFYIWLLYFTPEVDTKDADTFFPYEANQN